MPGLKKYFPDIRFSGNKVTPDEIDWRVRYSVVYPEVGTKAYGTVAPGTVTGAIVFDNTIPDFPRNVLVTIVGPAQGVGGTVTINGYNQFGMAQSETVTIGSANAGGTAAGTKIWDSFTSGTYYPNGGDNNSTLTIGPAIGTAAGIVGWLGLPVKIKSASDVKRMTFIKNGTYTAITGGTLASTLFSTANHAFHGTQIIAATDQYHLEIKPSYSSENDAPTA